MQGYSNYNDLEEVNTDLENVLKNIRELLGATEEEIVIIKN